MSTRKSQRIGIWIIASIMILGTIGGFAAMLVAPGNEAKDAAALKAAEDEYAKLKAGWQKKADVQLAELNDKYLATFSPFESRVASFDAEQVTELSHVDLVEGDGEEITGKSSFSTFYILWGPEGKVIQQTLEDGKLTVPLEVENLADSAMIDGWKEGLVGMKLGGIRELTIPYAKAYGDVAQSEDIPAKTPLKFIVMAIETPTEIPYPEMPQLLRKEYEKYGY